MTAPIRPALAVFLPPPAPLPTAAPCPRSRRPYRPRHRRRGRHRPRLRAAARRGRGQGAGGRPGRRGTGRPSPRRPAASRAPSSRRSSTSPTSTPRSRRAAGTDILVNNAGLQLVPPHRGVPARHLPHRADRDAGGPVPADPRRTAAHVRARLGPHRQRVVRPWAPRLRLQVGVCGGETRSGGPLQDRGPGRRAPRCHLQLCEPRLCAHPTGREAARRPGRRRTASPRSGCSPRSCCGTPRSNASSNRRRSPRPWPTSALRRRPSSPAPHCSRRRLDGALRALRPGRRDLPGG